MRYKGGTQPLMIYTTLRAAMICQACGLNKKIRQVETCRIFWWGKHMDSHCVRLFLEPDPCKQRTAISKKNEPAPCREQGGMSKVLPYQHKKDTVRCPFCVGGGSWIRTSEVSDNRFTVCPLWPLGNSPKNVASVELVNGVEPSTC